MTQSVAPLNPRGFTLVETLVAISIILTSIVGPLYAVQQSLGTSRTVGEQLIATSLAQEAIEYVRYVRDSNYLFVLNGGGSANWLQGFDGSASSINCFTSDCVVDPRARTIALAPSDANLGFLHLNASNLYTQVSSSGIRTPYKRTVRFSAITNNNPALTTEVLVTTTVTWSIKGQVRTVVMTGRLHNWL
jgi:prepilin-type N-terminal cleavage/methylation domain-containing protein